MKSVDPDVSLALEESLRRDGIEIFTSTGLLQVDDDAQCARVSFEHGEQVKHLEAARVLNALGRKPRLDGFEIESGGHQGAGVFGLGRGEDFCSRSFLDDLAAAHDDGGGAGIGLHTANQQCLRQLTPPSSEGPELCPISPIRNSTAVD